jgi:hypothetical protein
MTQACAPAGVVAMARGRRPDLGELATTTEEVNDGARDQ